MSITSTGCFASMPSPSRRSSATRTGIVSTSRTRRSGALPTPPLRDAPASWLHAGARWGSFRRPGAQRHPPGGGQYGQGRKHDEVDTRTAEVEPGLLYGPDDVGEGYGVGDGAHGVAHGVGGWAGAAEQEEGKEQQHAEALGGAGAG